jgi:hypothetical protein
MEEISADLPQGWHKLVFGIPAQFAVDAVEHHAGAHSVRMSASESARSFLVSDYLPVGVGETFTASAWVKCKDVPVEKGHVILIAEFANSKEQSVEMENCGMATAETAGWQLLQKTFKVPVAATQVRLRMGFGYAQGTIWWDAASLVPSDPLAMQLDIEPQHFVPGSVPINILNRAGQRGRARVGVAIGKTDVETKPLATQVVSMDLTGEPVQKVQVPIALAVRGKLKLIAELLPVQGQTPLFTRRVDIQVPPPITLQPLNPTHWAVEDGAAKIEGNVDVVVSAEDRKTAEISVQMLDSNKAVRAQWRKDKGTPAAAEVTGFSLQAENLPIGEYRVVATLHLANGKTIESEQPWSVIERRQARTTINAAGYPEIDGKAIYPLGVFNGRPKEEAPAGFTVSHAYNAARITADEFNNDQEAKSFLDQTQKAGMHACFMVPLKYAFEGKWDDFRRRIEMFRNHPALLCWDEEEGIARGDMTLDALRKVAEIVHEVDPNHPLMIGDARDVISRITDRSKLLPTDVMDLGMWWWYPFPMTLQQGDALQGEEGASANELVPPAFLVGAQTSKPIWTSLQAYLKNAKSRYPTPQEYRAQAYLGIISGAKGLMWYGGYVDGGIYHDEPAGHFKALEEVVGQLRQLSPVIMSPSGNVPAFTPKNAAISLALKNGPDGPVLFAVNRRMTPVDVVFDAAELPGGAVKVLYENRSVSASGRKMSDHFDGLSVHVYQFQHN